MFAKSSSQSSLLTDRDKGILAGIGRGTVPSRVWEESLDDVISQTSENIDKFNDLKSRSTSQKNSPINAGNCMHIYVNMNACICVETHVCIYTYVYIYIRIYTYIYMYMYIDIFIRINMRISTYMYIYIYIYIYTYIYIYVHIFVYIHKYVYIMDIHTYIRL
jgi:hypothetical protein